MSQPSDPQDDAVASDGDGSGGRRIAPREARQLAAQKRRSAKADAREEAANARAKRREAEAQRKHDEAAAASAKVQREDEERARKAAAKAEAEAVEQPVEQPVEPAPQRQSSVKTAGELATEADLRDRLREERAREEKTRTEQEKPDAAAAENEARAPKPAKPAKVPKPPRQRGAPNDRGWQIAAAVVGLVGLLCSVILAGGALLVAVGADQNSGIVGVVADTCDLLVGPLKGLFIFSGTSADLKAALVAWGLGSMIYLLVSRLLQSLLLRQVRDH